MTIRATLEVSTHDRRRVYTETRDDLPHDRDAFLLAVKNWAYAQTAVQPFDTLLAITDSETIDPFNDTPPEPFAGFKTAAEI